MNDVNEARKAFEDELQRITNKPPQLLTDRLIDLVRILRDELRKNDATTASYQNRKRT